MTTFDYAILFLAALFVFFQLVNAYLANRYSWNCPNIYHKRSEEAYHYCPRCQSLAGESERCFDHSWSIAGKRID